MLGDPFVVRIMTPDDLALAVEWAAGEGWNPGLDDVEAFRAADPSGFLMGFLDGEPVGCVSVVSYNDDFGFLGFYIVRPEFRGKGYGIRIWDAGMAYLAGRNVGLDGVVAQQDNYKTSGFQYAYANERFEGIGGGEAPGGVVDLKDVAFADVLAYDTPIFTVSREAFLKTWITRPAHKALGVIDDGTLKGYGVMRPCRNGCKIGPLFADTSAVAECLFANLIADAPGEAVFLDVPHPNSAALDLAKRHAMKPVFETARMYTRGDPGVPVNKVYGVTTFELG